VSDELQLLPPTLSLEGEDFVRKDQKEGCLYFSNGTRTAVNLLFKFMRWMAL